MELGYPKRGKTFNDNVWGHITLHRASVAVLDTPEFQRLRNLKQLGLAYYIYPGASHNRFEHSLGVAHLASEWGRQLITRRGQPASDGWQLGALEPEDRRHLTILQLAGLSHDLGHGPFSHCFEKELLPKLFPGDPGMVEAWHHEAMSNCIFEWIVSGDSGNGIDLQDLAGLDSSDVRLIKALMHGSSNPAADYPSAPWLFDVARWARPGPGAGGMWLGPTNCPTPIFFPCWPPARHNTQQSKRAWRAAAACRCAQVANKRNGVDVDKFDYLLRDSRQCGVSVPLDAQRLMLFSRLDRDQDQVTWRMSEYSNLALGLFQSRAEMHRRVYVHRKVKSIEFMTCDALALAQAPLGLREAVSDSSDLSAYVGLDDSLLQRLQALKPHEHEKPGDIEKAQSLLKALARRQLYKYVQEVTLNVQAQQRYSGIPTAEEIIAFQSSCHGVTLRAEDVIVCETKIDQGMRGANPMETVKFWQAHDPSMDASFFMPQQQVSSMLGTVYCDSKLRVYCKNANPAVRNALKAAFEAWCKQKLNCHPPGTPWRQPPPGAAYVPASAQAYASMQAGLAGGGGSSGPAARLFAGDDGAGASCDSGRGAVAGSAEARAGGQGSGRSRKRSLFQGPSQQSAAASVGAFGSLLSQGSQQLDAAEQHEQQQAAKQSRSGSGGGSAASRQRAGRAAAAGGQEHSQPLPGIAEE